MDADNDTQTQSHQTRKVLTSKHTESNMEGLLARNDPNILLTKKGVFTGFICLFIIYTVVHNRGRERVLHF